MNRKDGIWGDVQPNNMMTADVVLQWTTGWGGGGGGDVWTEQWEVRVRRAVARTLCEQLT